MEVIETNFGKVVKWGYNCEESLRDIRKMNGSNETPPQFEEFCQLCESIEAHIIAVCEVLDNICNHPDKVDGIRQDDPDGVWSDERDRMYWDNVDRLEKYLDDLDELCIHRYPEHAQANGCGWTV